MLSELRECRFGVTATSQFTVAFQDHPKRIGEIFACLRHCLPLGNRAGNFFDESGITAFRRGQDDFC